MTEPRVASRARISQAGEAVGHVPEGRPERILRGTRDRLEAGDSFHFPSDVPHGDRNPGRVRTPVRWVDTPPTF